MKETVKETVIERRGDGFAFRLPEQHRMEFIDGWKTLGLSLPGGGGSGVVEIAEDDDTRVVVDRRCYGHASGMGEPMHEVTGYPFDISGELARLKVDFVAAGGKVARADAWAMGASWNDHTRWLRDEIRLRGSLS